MNVTWWMWLLASFFAVVVPPSGMITFPLLLYYRLKQHKEEKK